MKVKKTMTSKWTYYISYFYFLFFYAVPSFTASILPPGGLSTANDTNTNDSPNSSLTLDHVDQKQNGTTKTGHLIANESTIGDVLLHQSNTSPDSKVNLKPSKDLPDEDVYSFTNLTSTANLTLNLYNSTHYKIWHHLLNFPNYLFCQFYQENVYIKKDPEVKKTYFGGLKLLAMFLAMAGVLACLLILIYCIYIRQHKEEMFSHHRLYGEGFEDPVLHLGTPVDHLDFFSFRDTELTPAPTPQHKCHKTETYETKGDYRVEAPKDTSTNDYLHQIIQMGSIKQ